MVTVIYANAIAKYSEGKLLDSEKLYRLADAEFSDAVKMLCEYGYGGGNVDEKNYDVDEFISSEISSLIDYALEFSPNEYLARVLTARFAYSNAKAYLKARYTGRLAPSSVYRMPDSEVREAIERGEYANLPKFMAEALSRLDIEFSDSKPDPKRIDTVLTEAMYADCVYSANKTRDKALRDYVTGEIDLKNIAAVMRGRRLGMSESAACDSLVSGGNLRREFFEELYRADEPAALLLETRYSEVLGEDGEIDIPRFEAATDWYLSEIWLSSAENMKSLSPFVSYFLAQLSEYKTVKMILTCLKNGARSEIFRRLRVAGKGA